jgi:hypothetical protein
MKENSLDSGKNQKFYRNVLIKTFLLFFIFNTVFAAWYPVDQLGSLSLYNTIVPGRVRLPYGDIPEKAYNLSIYNFEAMFSSHEIATPKPVNEYRVILIGDSSTWGFLQEPDQTLVYYLNQQEIKSADGRSLKAYNLGYPVMSLTKDLLILSYALHYDPDLIIWPFTLESFPYDKQLFPPLLQNNPEPVKALINQYNLNLNSEGNQLNQVSFWEKTIAGSRRELADLIRLQLYGVLWAATRVDQYIPEEYTARMEDLPSEESFHDLQPPNLKKSDLALEILLAAESMAGDLPILFINEPMFISQGENSHIRYNFYYPRWAYDDYREILLNESDLNNWHYLDLWDQISSTEFTNSAIHLTPEGSRQFAGIISEAIQVMMKGNYID